MKEEISEYYKNQGFDVVYVDINKDPRRVATLRNYSTKESKTMSYAKYLYTSFYKCEICKGDEVDHINGDKLDDRIENLQIISGYYNRVKDNKHREMVELTCPICGRTLVRMDRVKARSDDMLIIRGVNVFPSQIEHTLTKIKELNGAHYLLVVERAGLLDSLEIKVELNPAYFTDTIKNIEKLKKIVEHEVTSAIGIAPKITFCSPGEIPLSDGKTKRTIDNRKI